jgi:glycerophosphoryl diester phosphodiesterase
MTTLYAHRGDRSAYPENTLIAFAAGLDAHARGLECDVHCSADGEVVVCHDPTVDRTTNGQGRIDALRWAQLRALDAGAQWRPDPDPERANGGRRVGPTPFADRGITLPRLADVLERFPATPITVEFKSVAVAHPALGIIEALGARDRVLVGSFATAALQEARARGFRTTAAQDELLRLLPRVLVGAVPNRVAFDVLALPPRWYGLAVPVRALMTALRRPVHIWTVNDPAEARRFVALGVSAILSDAPGRLHGADPHIAFDSQLG